MAVRGRGGFDREDFDLVSGSLTMLSQYTANPRVETRLAAAQTADMSTVQPLKGRLICENYRHR